MWQKRTTLRSILKTMSLASAVFGAVFGATTAHAAAFPEKPITIVSPFPPGGAADALARLVGEQLGHELGATVLVENRVGASSAIGAAYVARAQPDGYTLLLATNTTLVTNRFLFKDLAYDPDAFEPVGMLGDVPMVLLASKKSGLADFPAFIETARQNPGKLTAASVGMGTTSHLALEQLRQMTGVDVAHVPYKGAAQIFPALASGDVDAFFDTISTGMPQVQGGRIDALAITTASRAAAHPELPTIAELGYPAFDMSIWFALMAPAGTPAPALERLREGTARAMADARVRDRVERLGITPTDTAPARVTDQVRKEAPAYEQLVKNAGIAQQ